MLVLIADDDAETCALVSAVLRKQNYRYIIARDAMQVMQLANQQQPDVIVLDLYMPAGTGIGALENLKRSTRTAQIPVVVLSGTRDPALIDRARQLGATSILSKPLDAEALTEAVRRATDTPPPSGS
jgi:two-component system, NtrC family, nitrogen regulation response regulator NtrX